MAKQGREVSSPFYQYLICSSKASHTGRIRQPGTGRTRAIFELATHIEYVRTAICRELVIAGVMRMEIETSDQTPHNTKGSMSSTGIPNDKLQALKLALSHSQRIYIPYLLTLYHQGTAHQVCFPLPEVLL
jgi:hypothetical protein